MKVLECFELQLDSSVFLDLIPIFPKVLMLFSCVNFFLPFPPSLSHVFSLTQYAWICLYLSILPVWCFIKQGIPQYDPPFFCFFLYSPMHHKSLDSSFNIFSGWKLIVLSQLGSISSQLYWWRKSSLPSIACEWAITLRILICISLS